MPSKRRKKYFFLDLEKRLLKNAIIDMQKNGLKRLCGIKSWIKHSFFLRERGGTRSNVSVLFLIKKPNSLPWENDSQESKSCLKSYTFLCVGGN